MVHSETQIRLNSLSYIVSEHLQLILVDAAASVHADAHQDDARLVDGHADGIRGTIACVPAAALARLSETVGRGLHRVERVQSINLIRKRQKKKN